MGYIGERCLEPAPAGLDGVFPVDISPPAFSRMESELPVLMCLNTWLNLRALYPSLGARECLGLSRFLNTFLAFRVSASLPEK